MSRTECRVKGMGASLRGAGRVGTSTSKMGAVALHHRRVNDCTVTARYSAMPKR